MDAPYPASMRFRTQRRIGFGHSDPAGIAFYPRFFEWFHDAFEEMVEASTGVGYRTWVMERKLGFPAVQVACEYRRPVQFGDVADIEVFASRFTGRSATFEYRLRQVGQLAATASVKIVFLDMAMNRPRPFPVDAADGLRVYLEPLDDEAPQMDRLRSGPVEGEPSRFPSAP
ncbi:MAG: acyl-CoA thioesterase [Myxococcota bacterium]